MKSVETKFNEVVASLTKANLYEAFLKKFTDRSKCPIEVQLNAGLALLKERGIVESITESGWGLTFAPKPRIAKKNGAGGTITESDTRLTEVNAKKEKLVESVMRTSNLTEASARQFLGLKARAPEGLTHRQETEYHIARKCGLSESDALVLAKMPLKEAFSPLPR
jgi:hypothetical protein